MPPLTGDTCRAGFLAACTLLTIGLGIRRLARTETWVQRHGGKAWWRLAARLLPRLVPTAILFSLPYLLGLLVGGGRDISLPQLAYYSPALMAWAAIAAVANLATIVVRVLGLLRRGGVPPARYAAKGTHPARSSAGDVRPRLRTSMK